MLALVIVMAVPCSVAGQPVTAAPAPPVASADAAVEAESRAIFTEVMSPFCPGLTLADCPSPDAFTMRGDIERRLKTGESRDAIVNRSRSRATSAPCSLRRS